MKISVICPTRNRHDRHPLLYSAFASQSYSDRELLLFDDSAKPSPFFRELRDERVRYYHRPGKNSIGMKRNELINLAKGEIIAHFDDDDYYAASYLETMLHSLGDASFIKLSKWLAWRAVDGSFWEWDTRTLSPLQCLVPGDGPLKLRRPAVAFEEDFHDSTLWGFGFSFVYRKSLWKKALFPDQYFGEDYHFVKRARLTGEKLIHTADHPDLALHIIHANNTSVIVPQRRLTPAQGLALFGEAVLPWLILEPKEPAQ